MLPCLSLADFSWCLPRNPSHPIHFGPCFLWQLHEKTKHCKCLAFNRRGTLLATGCHDGSCVLWDFDTRGIYDAPEAHTHTQDTHAHAQTHTAQTQIHSLVLIILPQSPPFPTHAISLRRGSLENGVAWTRKTSSLMTLSRSAPPPAGPSKILHEKDSSSSPVVAVSWSLNGRRLLTAEEKGRVRLWDVEKGTIIYTAKFDSVALTVQVRPLSLLVVPPAILLWHVQISCTSSPCNTRRP
jgi:WD40 repeat protein